MSGQLTWAWLALAATALWGLQYALWGRVLQSLSPANLMFYYTILCVPFYALVSLKQGKGFQLQNLLTPTLLMWVVLVVGLGVLANLGIANSMRLKNVTAATMIECSYPVFTGLFTWLIFRNLQFNVLMLLGLACVLVGVGLVAVAQE